MRWGRGTLWPEGDYPVRSWVAWIADGRAESAVDQLVPLQDPCQNGCSRQNRPFPLPLNAIHVAIVIDHLLVGYFSV